MALSTFDTGQPAFAPLAISANLAASMPGTFARVARWIAVIEKPPSTLSSVSDAFARLATIAAQLADSAQAVEQTIRRVRELDPAGELEQALRTSDACEGLR